MTRHTLVRLAALLPLPIIQSGAQTMFWQVLQRHPALLRRLDGHVSKRFAFLATDLGLAFIVSPAAGSIRVLRASALHRTGLRAPHATVSGPLPVLLSLLEGSTDGDAEFFARALTVEGDMEAVLALRNALDDAGVDLPTDLGALTGPLAPLATRAAQLARSALLGGRA